MEGSLTIPDIISGTKFIAGLPSFLRNSISTQEARKALLSRLNSREADFLTLAAKGIYANPLSPYRRMLRLAGCEYGDLAKLVKKEGMEGALGVLFRNGVYLSVNEYKGRVPTLTRNLQSGESP